MQKIGIAGLGTVGAEVARQILKHHDSLFEITCVCARDRNKDRDLSLSSSVVWCDTPSDMVDHCDVIIELMGGTGDHVANLVGKAINQNKAVITANKAYLAENLNLVDHELIKFEAAVAGGIPIIETMKTFVRTNRIVKISGIMNGTCNYILSNLEKGDLDYVTALKQAQEKGYAESDPTLDVSGGDQFQKSLILARMAFGDLPTKTNLQGINDNIDAMVQLASKANMVVRLVSEISQNNGVVHVNVIPLMIEKTNPFADIHGPDNAIIIHADPVGEVMLKGAGAGAKPTSSAILSDLLSVR